MPQTSALKMPFLLLKSGAPHAGKFSRSGRYVLVGGRWHALHHDEPAHKQAAAATLPIPEFEEGKTTTGVVDHYIGVAQKVLDLAAAGNVAGLQRMKSDGLLPNRKGKVSNTWAGKTQNSKTLLALHAEAVKAAGVGAAVSHLEQDQKQADIPSSEKKGDEGQGDLPAAEKRQDAKLVEKLEAAQAPAVPPNVAKLRAVADTLEAKASAEIGRDRLANTARRASMAGSAIASAEKEAAIARTMRNLAGAIESGEAKHLSGVGTKAAVEELDRALINAMNETDRVLSYAEQQRSRGRAPEAGDIRNAKLPSPTWDGGGSNRLRLLESLKGKRGAKDLMEKIRYSSGPNAEMLPALKKHITEKEIDSHLGWWNLEAIQRVSRLARIGINSNMDLRLALTEYVLFRDGPKKADPVKAAERALVGQKVGVDFFPTPKSLAERMAQLAGVKAGDKVLEPSAGNGNLADAAKAAGASVDAVEVSDALRNVLSAKGHNLVGRDFNDYESGEQYDAVIMNPPFSDRQDAAHIKRAWDMVKPGGRLVAIAGEGVFFGSDKKADAFRGWLDEHGAEVEKLPAGTFQDKSLLATTGANARLIVMQKPAGAASVEKDGLQEGEKNADGLVFRGGRWHRDDQEPVKNQTAETARVSADAKPADQEPIKNVKAPTEPVTAAPATLVVEHAIPKPEPRLILPKKAPVQASLFDETPPLHQKLDTVPWSGLKVGDDNKNAKSHNRQIDRIKALAYAGNLAGLEAMTFGSNTYGKRQEKVRQLAIAALKESPKLAEVDAAAHEAATSPHNDKPAPTVAQVAAGNYAKGHAKVAGLDVTIENPRGSVRSGKRPDGSKWEHTMSDHYGYIKRTTGADGEHVDVYVGPHVESDRVYVVDQVDAAGKFDEHKVMLGFSGKDEAVAAYASNFDPGWKVGPVTEMTAEQFKGWLKDGDTGKAVTPAADPGPHEGERNADGLVFRDGRWHREDEPAAATVDDGLSDDPSAPNYRFADTGYIAGSRKEAVTEQFRRAVKAGQLMRQATIDWEEVERNPREARELITKSNLFGQVDWASLREGGMEPGAGFLVDRIYASVASDPDRDSPQKRQDYALGLESLRDRLERCKAPQEVVDVLGEIRDELEGSILTEEQSQTYNALMNIYREKREVARQAKDVLDAYYGDYNRVRHELSSVEYQQSKRKNRGWKPDPDLQKQIDALQSEVEQAYSKMMAYREDHPELESKSRDLGGGWTTGENDLEWEASQYRRQAEAMMNAARTQNLINNPVTRAWMTLGPRFLAVLNYRRAKGSDAFAGHVSNARNGRIKDWSWAEKEGATVKKATKREVAFQLKVAEKYERKGGRDVTAASTAAFKDQFGLREVQSGNWVLNDPASAAWHVQKSTEAFADLADLLGAKDEQVSMHGRLALAFGARGRGNAGFGGAARAHYEAVQRVINLTKMGGGGTLAHEWAHALDNLCIEAESGKAGKDDFASENPGLLPAGPLRDAFVAVRSAMHDGAVQAKETLSYSGADVRLADLNVGRGLGVAQSIKNAGSVQAAVKAVDDHFGDVAKMSPKAKKRANDWRRIAVAFYDRNPEGGEVSVKAGPTMSSFAAEAAALDGDRSSAYWSQTHEMFARAFQAYCEDTLASKGRQSDYLSAMADNKYYVDPLFGIEWKPFPEGDERKRINAAFDGLVAALAKSGTLKKALELLA